MNANSIRIKGYPNGLIITYDNSLSFDEVCEITALKFSSSRKFFGNNSVCLILEGIEFSEEEENKIIQIIEENSDLSIVCIYKDNGEKVTLFNECIRIINENKDESNIYFCNKTLINEDFIKTTKDVVVIGDVNPGATIISKKNIYVYGALHGTVIAGFDNDSNDNIIMALEMNPLRMVIGDIELEDDNKKQGKWGIKPKLSPKIAYLNKESIVIEDYSKDLLDHIRF